MTICESCREISLSISRRNKNNYVRLDRSCNINYISDNSAFYLLKFLFLYNSSLGSYNINQYRKYYYRKYSSINDTFINQWINCFDRNPFPDYGDKEIINDCNHICITDISYMDDVNFLHTSVIHAQLLLQNMDYVDELCKCKTNSKKSSAVCFFPKLTDNFDHIIMKTGLLTDTGTIFFSTSFKYLGIIFDNTLTFAKHVAKVIRITNTMANKVHDQMRKFMLFNPLLANKLFQAYVQSVIETYTTPVFLSKKQVSRIYNNYFRNFKRINVNIKSNNLMISLFFGLLPMQFRYPYMKFMLFYDLLARDPNLSMVTKILIQSMINVKNYDSLSITNKLLFKKYFQHFEKLSCYKWMLLFKHFNLFDYFSPNLPKILTRNQWKKLVIFYIKKDIHSQIWFKLNNIYFRGNTMIYDLLVNNKIISQDSNYLFRNNVILCISTWCNNNNINFRDLNLHPQIWNILMGMHQLHWRNKNNRIFDKCIYCKHPWNNPFDHMINDCPCLCTLRRQCLSKTLFKISFQESIFASSTILNEFNMLAEKLINIDSDVIHKPNGFFQIYGLNISQFNYFIWNLYKHHNFHQNLQCDVILDHQSVKNSSYLIAEIPFFNMSNSYSGNIIDFHQHYRIASQRAFINKLQGIDQNDLISFSDGACKGNPGPAGAAAILFTKYGDSLFSTSKALGYQTNNKAELYAIWLVFKLVLQFFQSFKSYNKKLHIFTDSDYCISLFNTQAIPKANKKLFYWIYDELLFFKRKYWKIYFYYVKSHAKIHFNEKVDSLAVKARKKQILYDIDLTTRPLTPLRHVLS